MTARRQTDSIGTKVLNCALLVALAGFPAALWRGGAALEDSGLVGEYDRLDAVPEAELGQDVRDVGLDGRLADVEPR